jgi:RNA polymerase sigma-70 factor (ECF subfamily)
MLGLTSCDSQGVTTFARSRPWRAQRNDNLADWESIVRKHGPTAFDAAWRILGHVADTEEAVQDALLDAFRLHQDQAITNWGGLLRHLASRRALDRLRKRKRMKPLTEDPPSSCDVQPANAAIEHELAEQLRATLAQLPNRQASVFSLRHFAGMTNTQIAGVLQISTNAVGVALHKARGKLEKVLEDKELSERGRNDE